MGTTAWFNGRFQDIDTISVPAQDRGFLLGDGVFDTMAVKDGALEHADFHMARLYKNAQTMHIKIPYQQTELSYILLDMVNRNKDIANAASIRTTISRGTGQRGITVTGLEKANCLITMTAYNAAASESPAKLIVARTVRRNEHSVLSKIKSLNYADNVLAKIEADQKGADDAILLNSKGNITCTTNANIFIETQNGEIITPPIKDGVLGGTIRNKLISEGNAQERSTTLEDLLTAKSAFLTNSLIGKRTVLSVEGKAF